MSVYSTSYYRSICLSSYIVFIFTKACGFSEVELRKLGAIIGQCLIPTFVI